MPNNVIKSTYAGFDALHFAYRAAQGYIAGFGNLKTTSTPGTSSGMRRLSGAQAFPLQVKEWVAVPIKGDDGRIRTFYFPNSDVNAGILDMGMNDLTSEAAFEGKLNYVLGNWTKAGRGGAIANPGVFMFLGTRQAKAEDSGNAGQAGFWNELWLSCNANYLGDEGMAHQREGKNRINVSADPSTVGPWGNLISTDFGKRDLEVIAWFSTYRAMYTTHVGDGASAVVQLDYTPIDAASTKAFNALTGAALTVSSVNTTTKTATLSAAPASGAISVVEAEVLTF